MSYVGAILYSRPPHGNALFLTVIMVGHDRHKMAQLYYESTKVVKVKVKVDNNENIN
jgi:hypothetical protein